MPKKCYLCKKLKADDSFNKNKRTKDGLSNYCKECHHKQHQAYYKKHKDSVLKRNKERYAKKRKEIIERLKKESKGSIIPLDGETWMPVKGLEGRYEVSNRGRVKSLSFAKSGVEKLLSIGYNCHGYKKVMLQVNNKSKSFLVHRLVAEAFIPNSYDKPFVNHIDGDKANSDVNNLEWVTERENVNHYYRVLMGKPCALKSGRHHNWQWKAVRCIETGEIFPNIASAARSINVCDKAISQLLTNPTNRHTAGGYHWELVS